MTSLTRKFSTFCLHILYGIFEINLFIIFISQFFLWVSSYVKLWKQHKIVFIIYKRFLFGPNWRSYLKEELFAYFLWVHKCSFKHFHLWVWHFYMYNIIDGSMQAWNEMTIWQLHPNGTPTYKLSVLDLLGLFLGSNFSGGYIHMTPNPQRGLYASRNNWNEYQLWFMFVEWKMLEWLYLITHVALYIFIAWLSMIFCCIRVC